MTSKCSSERKSNKKIEMIKYSEESKSEAQIGPKLGFLNQLAKL